MNPCDAPELADEILEEFHDICESLDIIFFLAAGTCLGFYRDEDYIQNDNDIDIRVICNDVRYKLLMEALGEHGFVAAKEPGYETKHFRKHDILFDIKQADGSEFHFYTIELGDCSYNLPHPIEEYLTRLYGMDWPTPQWKPLRSSEE